MSLDLPQYVRTQKMVDEYLEFVINEKLIKEYHALTIVFEYGTMVMIDKDDYNSYNLSQLDVGEYVKDLLKTLVSYINIDSIIKENTSYLDFLLKNRVEFAIALIKLLRGPKQEALEEGVISKLISKNTEIRKHKNCSDFFYLCPSSDGNRTILDFVKPRVIGYITPEKEFVSI